MDDAVVQPVALALEQIGLSHIRFNFRGVRGSAGEYDEGVGERDDLEAVVREIESKYSPQSLILCGYSFGSMVVYGSIDRYPKLSRVMLIAPPLAIDATKLLTDTDIIVGDADPYCDVNYLTSLNNQQSNIQLHVVENADHFFADYYADVVTTIQAILSP